MRIFLLLSAIPYDKGEAIEIVSHEVVRLMAGAKHEVHVLALIREARSELNIERECYAAEQFSNEPFVHLQAPIYLGEMIPSRSTIGALATHMVAIIRSLPGLRVRVNSYLFTSLGANSTVRARVAQVQPDVIVSIWSWEALAASYDITEVPKFVYYGNPNHKPPEAQFQYPELFDIETRGPFNWLKFRVLKLLNKAREIQHLRMMAECEATANNALIDAQYYSQNGHPNSLYLQNMWPEAPGGPVFGGCSTVDGYYHLCGSVGNLGATGNTFGLYCLGAELAPRLEAALGRDKVVIHVFGGGRPRRRVEKVLKRNSIRLRGWVDDLNAEIIQSCAFLVLTNMYGFNVGNTRILLAWSLGACVVAHTSSALSMPELEHGKNALLGETIDEISELIVQAVKERELRERIGRGGYETFWNHYRSEVVVPKMLQEIGHTVREFGTWSANRC